MIGPSIETRIVQESGEAYSNEPTNYLYHGQGMETGKFVLHAIADDGFCTRRTGEESLVAP
jgi:hypothetical protein